MRNLLRSAALVLLALMAAAPPGTGGPAAPRRVAVVIGISEYEPMTRVPQLPQYETSARGLAKALEGQVEARLLIRRVIREEMLDAIRSAGSRCGRDDFFVVFLVCAADRDGLIATDGRITPREVREAVDASPAAHRALLVDGAGGTEMVGKVRGGDTVTLGSTSLDQEAWSAFFPQDDDVRFESAASHGWQRALTRSGAGWDGDLGMKGSLGIEDLRLSGDGDAAQALPDREGRRMLDEELGMKVLRAVRPSAARKLRDGGEVSIEDLRRDLGAIRFMQLAGVFELLSGEAMRGLEPSMRKKIVDSLERSDPMEALQALHNLLLRERLLHTPSETETRIWKRLVPVPGRQVSAAIVLPATQESSFRGPADLAVFGPRSHVRYRVPYGRYEGDGTGGDVRARLRVEVLGTYVSGQWEGEMDGKWLRGDWQGTLDARSGRLQGRVISRLQPEDVTRRAPAQTVWPAVFEGNVSDDGTLLSGTWRSAARTLPVEGRWRTRK